MTDEEMQRKMNFIVDQQAQFSADIQRLKELHEQAQARMTQSEARMTHIEGIVLRLEDVVLRLANATETRITSLTEKMENLAVAMSKLAESQAHTDERLDALIDIIRRERNGNSQG